MASYTTGAIGRKRLDGPAMMEIKVCNRNSSYEESGALPTNHILSQFKRIAEGHVWFLQEITKYAKKLEARSAERCVRG